MTVSAVPTPAASLGNYDPPPLSVIVAIAVRYPRWTVWFGQATRHWWALPPVERDIDTFVEAPSARELIEAIDAIQRRSRAGVLGALKGAPGGATGGMYPASQARSQAGAVGRAASPSNTSVTGVAVRRALV